MSDSTSRLLRGFLEPCLLALLTPGPDYGLSLMRRLSAAGLEDVPGGSLYPALTRLDAPRPGEHLHATLRLRTGPQVLRAHGGGRNELGCRRAEWRSFRTAFSAILESSTATTEARS